MRSVWPSVSGFRPSPAARIAFSVGITSALSHTLTVIIRGSGTLIEPTELSGMVEP